MCPFDILQLLRCCALRTFISDFCQEIHTVEKMTLRKKKSPGTQRAHNLERVLEHKKKPFDTAKVQKGGQIGQVLFLGKKPSPYLLPFKETFNMSRKTLKIIVRILDPSKER